MWEVNALCIAVIAVVALVLVLSASHQSMPGPLLSCCLSCFLTCQHPNLCIIQAVGAIQQVDVGPNTHQTCTTTSSSRVSAHIGCVDPPKCHLSIH